MLVALLLVVVSFTKSFWLGILVLGYVLYAKGEYKKIKNQLDMYLTENKNDRPKMPKFNCMANQMYPYKECVIEEHKSSIFQIVKPSNEILDKVFYTLEDAKKEIDIVCPFFSKTKKER